MDLLKTTRDAAYLRTHVTQSRRQSVKAKLIIPLVNF